MCLSRTLWITQRIRLKSQTPEPINGICQLCEYNYENVLTERSARKTHKRVHKHTETEWEKNHHGIYAKIECHQCALYRMIVSIRLVCNSLFSIVFDVRDFVIEKGLTFRKLLPWAWVIEIWNLQNSWMRYEKLPCAHVHLDTFSCCCCGCGDHDGGGGGATIYDVDSVWENTSN